MQEQASSAAAQHRHQQPPKHRTTSPWVLAAAIPLLLAPAGVVGAEFCPAPATPRGWRSAGRVFHDAPRVVSLRIGEAAPIPCRALPDQAAAICGAYRLSYAPWDPFPELVRLSLQRSDGNRTHPGPAGVKAQSARLMTCTSLAPWRDEDGALRLQVLSQRELRARFPGPLGLVTIRESFLSHHPLVPEGIPSAAGSQP